MFRHILVSCFLALLLCQEPNQACEVIQRPIPIESGSQRRRALVIGNSSYASKPISTAVQDAKAMEHVLRTLQFDVQMATDTNRKQFAEILDQFIAQLHPNDVALFYYSGHTVQLDGESFLIPVDFSGRDSYDVQYDGYPIERLQKRLELSGAALSVLVLDAGRDSPFPASKSAARATTRMGTGKGTFIAFAAEAGTVHSDFHKGANSIFTWYLVGTLTQPGLSLQDIFNKVRADVVGETNGQQIPVQLSNMVGRFYFLPPSDSAAYTFQEAITLIKMAKPRESIAYFDRAIELKPDYLAAYVNRGAALVAIGEDNRANRDFQVAVSMTPSDSSDYVARGRAYLALQRRERALADFNAAIKFAPRSAEVYEYRGKLLMELNEFQQAIEDFNQEIRLTPTEFNAYALLGTAYLRLGEHKSAVDNFTVAIQRGPDPLAYEGRASAYTALRQFDLAIVDLAELCKLEPSEARFHDSRAELLQQIGSSGEAESEYRTALKLKADDHRAMNNLGYMFAERNTRLDEARDLVLQALTLQPGNGAYLDSLGWIYYRMGKLSEAEHYLKMAVAQTPGSIEEDHLGDVYWAQERKREAIDQWQVALKALAPVEGSPDVGRLQKKIKLGLTPPGNINAPTGVAKQKLWLDQSTVEFGQPCKLAWQFTSGNGFLSGIGKVDSSGSTVVKPEFSTTYTLLVWNGDVVEDTSVTVTVVGAKGDSSQFPDISDFTEPGVSGKSASADYLEFLGFVHRKLQDEFAFRVKGDFLPGRPWSVLYTNRQIRDKLVRLTDRGVRHRRIAYYVRIDQLPRGKLSHFEVRTLLQYQLFGESTWRPEIPEIDAQIGHAAAEELRNTLQGK